VRLINNPEKMTKVERVVICADGASRGNPGLAAIGATIKDRQGRLIASVSQCIGRTTNNQAEYRALIAALEEATRLGAREVAINLDSQLVVRQIRGEYRVKKAELKPLYQRVKQLQSCLESCTINYIPRQQNIEADRMANSALK
jgi:ribonuclease HI|tara:strand:+ start:1397 stop:1828 length:432 start_codon:yes stop_codon:yes gene_type:complete